MSVNTFIRLRDILSKVIIPAHREYIFSEWHDTYHEADIFRHITLFSEQL